MCVLFVFPHMKTCGQNGQHQTVVSLESFTKEIFRIPQRFLRDALRKLDSGTETEMIPLMRRPNKGQD